MLHAHSSDLDSDLQWARMSLLRSYSRFLQQDRIVVLVGPLDSSYSSSSRAVGLLARKLAIPVNHAGLDIPPMAQMFYVVGLEHWLGHHTLLVCRSVVPKTGFSQWPASLHRYFFFFSFSHSYYHNFYYFYY